MRVHDAVARALVDHRVDVVFGLVGDGNIHTAHSLVTEHGIRYVAAAHESSAVLMADGYARLTGRLGVATVTHGPGVTNTVTALTEAARARTPLLLVTSDTPPEDRQHSQRVPMAEVVAPTGSAFVRLRTAATAVEDVAIAVRRALLERRPVVLVMPVELQREEIVDGSRVFLLPESAEVRPDDETLNRAAGVLAAARRPVVLAGRGAIHARGSVLALAHRLGAPVATTLLAKGLFAGEPEDLGVFGTLSTPGASDRIAGADVLVVLGAGLNRHTSYDEGLTSGKAIVQVDVDPEALGRWVPVDAPIVGDAASAATRLTAMLDEAGTRATGYAAGIPTDVAEDPTLRPRDDGAVDTIDIRGALRAIEGFLPADRVVVTDAGRFLFTALRTFTVARPGSLVVPTAFGSIGLGMGEAIGAAVGTPDRPTLLVCGDGGFMTAGVTEFATAVREGLDLVVVVVNDGGYGAEHVLLRRMGVDPTISLVAWPELAPLAEALGGHGVAVRNEAGLETARKVIETRSRPVLLDVKVDPDTV